MFFHSLFQKDATPLLRAMGQFTGKRHGLLLNDIANVDTPYYRSKSLDLNAFQKTLAGANTHRKSHHPRHFAIGNNRQVSGDAISRGAGGGAGSAGSQLSLVNDPHLGPIYQRQSSLTGVTNSQVKAGIRGNLSFRPESGKFEGMYKYDHTSGSIERTMSDLAKNTLMGRTFGSLLAKKYRMLDTAIRERP